MREVRVTRQDAPSLHKSWFNDRECDLFVWRNHGEEIVRFQFCYGKPVDEHVAEWSVEDGLTHMRVDDGERGAWSFGMTPIFVPDGVFDRRALAETLRQHAQQVPADIVEFVSDKLLHWDGVAA